MKTNDSDSMLCRIAGQMAGIHWLPINYPLGGKLNDVLCFAGGLPDAGLPFQARSRDDRQALNDLRKRGLIDVQGQTSGVHVSLTLAGAAALWDMAICQQNLVELSKYKTVKTPWGQSIIMGFELCPTAGDWWIKARSSDAAWNLYRDELSTAMTALTPQLILGWVRQYVSTEQQFWGVQLTDSGRQALTSKMPGEPRGFRWNGEAYVQGRDDAVKRYSQSPPDSENAVARMLPSSKWF